VSSNSCAVETSDSADAMVGLDMMVQSVRLKEEFLLNPMPNPELCEHFREHKHCVTCSRRYICKRSERSFQCSWHVAGLALQPWRGCRGSTLGAPPGRKTQSTKDAPPSIDIAIAYPMAEDADASVATAPSC
jgi:hypothetical protein